MKVATYHLALLLNLNGQFEDAWELLAIKLGRNQLADQTKTALALALLRVPLLPDQVDPSKDALIDAAGKPPEIWRKEISTGHCWGFSSW